MGSSGTTIDCAAESENEIRIIARQTNSTDDPSQSSLSLDPAVISTGFQNNGQDNITASGQCSFLILSHPLNVESDTHLTSTERSVKQ